MRILAQQSLARLLHYFRVEVHSYTRNKVVQVARWKIGKGENGGMETDKRYVRGFCNSFVMWVVVKLKGEAESGGSDANRFENTESPLRTCEKTTAEWRGSRVEKILLNENS